MGTQACENTDYGATSSWAESCEEMDNTMLLGYYRYCDWEDDDDFTVRDLVVSSSSQNVSYVCL